MTNAPAVPLPSTAEADAERRLRANRFDVGALMDKADHRFHAGDHRAAASFYRSVVRLYAQQGVQSAADRAVFNRAEQMVAWFDALFRDHMLGSLEKAGFGLAMRHPRFQKSLEMMLGERDRPPAYQRYPQMPLVYYYPDLPYVQFADPAGFEWVPRLRAEFGAMRDEARRLLDGKADFQPYVKANAQRPQGDVHGLLENPDWSTLFLWENGAPVDEHIVHCPRIFDAVMKHVPLCHIGSRAPSVMLSLLRAGSKIPPHTGMVNCRYICHLPLIVPPDCGFRVGERTINWKEGEVIIFDDTVEHEAWNNSQQDRLVLIFDVWRPELVEGEQAQIQALFNAVDSY